jgi:quercetin dioxygenase-like cupin family protein
VPLPPFIRHGDEGSYELVEPGISVRDLGIGEITGGEYTLQLVRIEPEGAHVADLHRHDERFSLAYVLNGWLDVELSDLGRVRLEQGAVVLQRPGVLHRSSGTATTCS